MHVLRQVSDYAFRCLVCLSRRGEGHVESTARLASMAALPEAFLRKILQKLARAGIVRSVSGVKGGFHLSLAPEKITALMVVEAVQGPVAISRCFLGKDRCLNQTTCDLRSKLTRMQKDLEELLQTTTIRDLAERAPHDRSARARSSAAGGERNCLLTA